MLSGTEAVGLGKRMATVDNSGCAIPGWVSIAAAAIHVDATKVLKTAVSDQDRYLTAAAATTV